jgi:endoglucanase
MTISVPPRSPDRDDRNEIRPPDEKGMLAGRIFGRRRRLTAFVVAWVLLVVGVAAFLLYRNSTETDLSQVAATQVSDQLFVDPNSQAAAWVRANAGSPQAKEIEQQIATRPTAKWFGAWSGDITDAVSQYTGTAADQGKIPVLVAYNLPDRDCGGQSAGGAASPQEYNKWIDGFSAGLDGRRSIVVLEPDSLAMLDSCLDAAGQQTRLEMLSRAVSTLQSRNVWVYLDAGHSNWVPADEMAKRLSEAGVAKAHGFSLNVSNYNPTEAETAYGSEIDDALGTPKPFIVDTSRNGNGGADGQWCNPPGRKLGPAPQAGGAAEMLLWLKAPGESDGDCGAGTGTAAGEFSPKLATELINGR